MAGQRVMTLVRHCLLLLMLCGAAAAHAQIPVPPLQARVTDQTQTLSDDEVSSLEQKLYDFERRKGSQVAVLIVPTTAPESIEQFGIRVAQTWKLGRQGVDDGALLLVAKNDHKLRIEVGYGLEGSLTDATCKRIIDEIIVPRFHGGDFDGGVDAGVSRMLSVIDGEPLPPPTRTSSYESQGKATIWIILMLAVMMSGAVLRTRRAAAITACVAGVVGWFVSGVLLIGAGIAVLAFILALTMALYDPNDDNWWYRRSWWSGWGGGFGGGGFSGGGGSFGGGGASGSW